MTMQIKVRFVAAHWNARANSMIPAYFTPEVDHIDGIEVFPCGTEEEARQLGAQMVAEGLAEAM